MEKDRHVIWQESGALRLIKRTGALPSTGKNED